MTEVFEHRLAAPKSPNGFTLIETLVALAIFSLAALALLRLQGATLGRTARLDEKTVAGIVAQNQAALVLIAAQAPAFGVTQGEDSSGGRRWHWTQRVLRSPDVRLQRIEISVAGGDGGTAASVTIIRRAA